MADPKKILEGNVPGDFFVDSSCQNFDICRQIAADTFGFWQDYAVVVRQPETAAEERRAIWALLSCPKGSIGKREKASIGDAFNDFPLPIEDKVFYCGFNSAKSAGANSYFIQHEDGNWLVAAPKFQEQLVTKYDTMGGVRYIFLSHRDDVGETAKFAERFAADVIIHEEELEAYSKAAIVISGSEPKKLSGDFRVLPTPGHTEGHMMLLFADKFLFSGDSLKFNRQLKQVETWDPQWTWFDYRMQAKSVAGLADFSFQWLLPSHGTRVKFEPDEMQAQIRRASREALADSPSHRENALRLSNMRAYLEDLRAWKQPLYEAKVLERIRNLEAELQRRTEGPSSEES